MQVGSNKVFHATVLRFLGLLGVMLVFLLSLKLASNMGAHPVIITWLAIIGNAVFILVIVIILSRRSRPRLPLSIWALFAVFFGVFMFVSKRFGADFWFTPEGAAVAAVLGLTALLASYFAFRRLIRQGWPKQ